MIQTSRKITIMRYILISIIALLVLLFASGAIIFFNSPFMLKQQIAKDYPEIKNKGITDWEKVNILRQWAYTNIDTSTKSNLIDQDEFFNFYKRNVQDIFKAFSQDKGGVWCYGAAFSLEKLYNAYGFKAYTVDMGNTDVMTHVATLVEINYKNQNIISIQDPTFNLTYIDNNGNPYNYLDFIKTLKNNDRKKIKILYGKGAPPECIVVPKDDPYNGSKWNAYRNPYDKPIKTLSDGREVYVSRMSYKRFKIENGKNIKNFLKAQNYPAHTIYLFLFPLSIRGDDGAQELIDQAISIIK